MTARMRVSWRLSKTARDLITDPSDIEGWLLALHAAEPVTILTRSRTTDTSIVEVPSLGRAVRKRWRWPGVTERLKGVGRTTALASTPAEREFTALERTYGERGIEFHPAPLAAFVERSGGLASGAMLLLTEIEGSVDLAEFLRDERASALRRDVLADLAARIAAMHGDGVTDGDLHPRNVLVDAAGPRTWKVDCGRQRAQRQPASRRRAEYDLACLDVGLARFASAAERTRALAAYLAARGASTELRSWATRVAAMGARLAPKEADRLPPPSNK